MSGKNSLLQPLSLKAPAWLKKKTWLMNKSSTETKPLKAARSSGFVADGLDRLLSSKWYKQRRTGIELEIRERYAAELKSADWWRKVEVKAKIQREVARELEKIWSPHSLWLSS